MQAHHKLIIKTNFIFSEKQSLNILGEWH